MNAIHIIFAALVALSSIALIVAVLLQEGSDKGLGALTGESETFFGKNKAKTKKGKLALVTKASAIVFIVSCLAMVIF